MQRPLTRQLPLLGRNFSCRLDHWHRAKVAVGDAHEEGEETRPGGVGQGGCIGGVHAHDEQRDEDHPEAGEEEQASPRPVVRQRSQDLRGESRALQTTTFLPRLISLRFSSAKMLNWAGGQRATFSQSTFSN